MEALCEYGDSSDDESDAGSDSFADEKAEEKQAEAERQEPVKKSKLPSAAELLGKSHKAAFLAHAREQPSPSATVEEAKRAESQAKPEAAASTVAQERAPSSSVRRQAKLSETEVAEPAVRTDNRKQPRGTQAKGTKDESNAAKDRVKRQRLRGQAGIGSDFRTWKSEEEMRMRQQFDA